MLENGNKLPIEIGIGIDVISVGISFLRFLEIAEKINIEVVVVTDNDGSIEALNKKYKDYLGEKIKKLILKSALMKRNMKEIWKNSTIIL